MNTVPEFSWVTIILLLCGWATHWLVAVRKARAVAAARGGATPSLLSYWTADPYSLVLSVIGLVVIYFVLPHGAVVWPEFASLIGATPQQPMTPAVAYLGGVFAPWVADYAGKRLEKMIGAGP
jgi:hypothetical protein